MTVDEVMRWIRLERRRQMRAFLSSVRFHGMADRFVEHNSGYDPAAFREWLEEEAAE